MGATDCSFPILWAEKAGVAVDVFIVFTDNETVTGDIHPATALRQYRKVNAPYVVVWFPPINT